METHTKQLRKESFKTQSKLVTLQSEAKAAQEAAQRAQEELAKERKLSDERKQEAFTANYQLVGVQQELSRMSEAARALEQERDALRAIAKNEEIARIAAEGRIPLPLSKDDEFSSPRRLPRDLPAAYVSDSEEVEELRTALMWEKRRADVAYQHVSFLELECEYKVCACHRGQEIEQNYGRLSVPTPVRRRTSQGPKPSPKRTSTLDIFVSPKRARQSEPLPAKQPTQADPEPEVSQEVQDYFSPKPLSKDLEHRLSPYHDIAPPSPPAFHGNSRSHTPSEEPESKRHSLMSLLDADEAPNSPSSFHGAYRTVSHTTSIPLASPSRPRPMSINTNPETLNSALADDIFTPTLSREESLARIASMRGRTKSFVNGTLTPKKAVGLGIGVEAGDFRSAGHKRVKSFVTI